MTSFFPLPRSRDCISILVGGGLNASYNYIPNKNKCRNNLRKQFQQQVQLEHYKMEAFVSDMVYTGNSATDALAIAKNQGVITEQTVIVRYTTSSSPFGNRKVVTTRVSKLEASRIIQQANDSGLTTIDKESGDDVFVTA